MNIEKYLQDLLFTNETVVIPDFGAFKSKYKSAEINYESKSILPPKKDIIFDSTIVRDDKILINYISEKEKISVNEAKDIVFKFVSETFIQLRQGISINLPGIGNISMDKRNIMQFESDKSINYFVDSYGMQPIKITTEKLEKTPVNKKAIINSAKSNIKKPVAKKTEVTATIKKKSYTLYFLLGAAAIIIALVVFGLTTSTFDPAYKYITGLIGIKKQTPNTVNLTDLKPNQKSDTKEISATDSSKAALQNTDKNKEQLALTSENTNNLQKKETSSKIESTLEEVNKKDEKKKSVKNEPNKKVKTSESKQEYVEPKVKANSKKKFYLIAGSYNNTKNANQRKEKFIRDGFQSEVLDQENGVYRVTVGAFDTKNAAMIELEKIRSQKDKSEVWILSK